MKSKTKKYIFALALGFLMPLSVLAQADFSIKAESLQVNYPIDEITVNQELEFSAVLINNTPWLAQRLRSHSSGVYITLPVSV